MRDESRHPEREVRDVALVLAVERHPGLDAVGQGLDERERHVLVVGAVGHVAEPLRPRLVGPATGVPHVGDRPLHVVDHEVRHGRARRTDPEAVAGPHPGRLTAEVAERGPVAAAEHGFVEGHGPIDVGDADGEERHVAVVGWVGRGVVGGGGEVEVGHGDSWG